MADSSPARSRRSCPLFSSAHLHLAPIIILGLLVATTARAQLNYETPFFITTLAGYLVAGSADGTGSAARFSSPSGVAVDASDNIYVADTSNHTIRKITPGGVVTTLAGVAGVFGRLNGVGSEARFSGPRGVAVDGRGDIYVADTSNNAIRKITPNGVVTTVAGGNLGSLDEIGTTARFNGPWAVAIEGNGTLYVSDAFNHTIRKITPNGQVTTLAGSAGSTGFADGVGSAARFYFPRGIAVDGSANVYVSDSSNFAVRKITPDGTVTTLAGAPVSANLDGTGSAARFSSPWGLALDPAGNVYVSQFAGALRKITAAGVVTTLAGSSVGGSADGTGSAARFANPYGIAIGAGGKLYVADTNNFTIRVGIFPPPVPLFGTQPVGQTVPPGGSGTFTATATSQYATTYQWQKDGVAIPGATDATLSVANVQSSSLGNYRVVATNVAGSATSNIAVLSFALRTASRLANLSIRTNTAAGAETLIVGLVVGGAGTIGAKPLLIRGAGPALGGFGVTGFLVDPALSVYSESNVVAANDNWAGDVQVTAIGAQVGAFAFGSATSRDAALYTTFNPAAYTVQIAGSAGTSGIALAEIYDATPASAFFDTTPRLVNVSARTLVGTDGGIVITGFSISGATPKTLLIRAVGPTLGVFGVAGALADPKLDLFSGSTLVQSNDNWGGGAEIARAAASVGAFGLDGASKDAVLLATLPPGSYTAQVSGVGNTTGVALVEIYEVP